MKSTSHRRASAFSLIEVVIVSGVAVTLFTMILGMQINASQTRVFTQERDVAREAAAAKLEEITAASFPTVEATFGGVDFEVEGLRSSVASEGAGTVSFDTSTAPASPGDNGLKRVRVQIRWLSAANGGNAEVYTLETMIANREVQ